MTNRKSNPASEHFQSEPRRAKKKADYLSTTTDEHQQHHGDGKTKTQQFLVNCTVRHMAISPRSRLDSQEL